VTPHGDHPRIYPIAKRLFDVTAGVAGAILLSPVLVATALAVKFSSPGPVFYRGVRIGRHGRPFRIVKFRTMQVGSEELGTTTKLRDPRITSVGTFLRRYKLDELPQLWNVVRGEMSVVGPRPEVEEHTSAYSAEERSILDVRPGITDYSSIRFASLDEVLGADNPHDVYVTRIRAEKNKLRLAYVRNQSFVEDLRIVMKTLGAIAGKFRQHSG
jgi:lipopolysaccharide/colanic/teichoic acid biosynthesis glycosyltransferase